MGSENSGWASKNDDWACENGGWTGEIGKIGEVCWKRRRGMAVESEERGATVEMGKEERKKEKKLKYSE